MKYSQAVLFIVGSGVLGGVLGVATHPNAGHQPVPALGNGATQLGQETTNSTDTLLTTAGHPDGPASLKTTTQLAANPEGAASTPGPHTSTRKSRRKKSKKSRTRKSKKRLASQQSRRPVSESVVAPAPQNTTEPSIPHETSTGKQMPGKADITPGSGGTERQAAAEIPRGFEDDDLFVRGPEAATSEAAPATPSERNTIHRTRHTKKLHRRPVAEVPTTRDVDEDLYVRMVQTLAELDERDILDLADALAARDFAYEMDQLD